MVASGIAQFSVPNNQRIFNFMAKVRGILLLGYFSRRFIVMQETENNILRNVYSKSAVKLNKY